MAAISKALVIGGGIGGLTAAIALKQQGIDVDLVEIAPDLSVYGVGIIQPNNALRALDKIGVAQTCVDEGGAFEGWKIFDAHGNPLMEGPNSSDAAPGYPPINGITRPKLHRILGQKASAEGVRITLNMTVAELTETEDRVNVTFIDGSLDDYDLVIACDGMRSQMRSRLFPDVSEPKFTGQGVWRYNLPRPKGMEWGQMYFGPDSKVGLVPMSPSLMYMFVVTEEPGNPKLSGPKMAEMMRSRLTSYTGEVARLREMITKPEGVVYRPMEVLLLPRPWNCGRTIIIGDAAHSSTPHLAQGAAMAIEDAVLLGELLGQDRPISDILIEFMERRFARAKSVFENSVQIGKWEMEQWAGIENIGARPGELLHETTAALMANF